ncbi:unnamed protein product, partial [Phaeothamnion confervicola]
IQPGARDSLTREKVTSFAIGQQKKTRFQKEKEANEARKKAEEEATASVFDDFVASFGAGGGRSSGEDLNAKTFMRGGDVNGSASEGAPPGQKNAGGGFGGGGGGGGFSGPMGGGGPPGMPGFPGAMGGPPGFPGFPGAGMGPAAGAGGGGSGGGPGGPKKGGRQIDDFLAEIRNRVDNKPDPAAMMAMGGGGGGGGGMQFPMMMQNQQQYPQQGPPPGMSRPQDEGDPTSTNLYLGNLAPSITEETLQELFSRYGEIYSIKIMWPRTEEERNRKRNCGFVSFWRRQDAESAKNAMTDQTVQDYRMSIGWGKAINKLLHRIGDETRVSEDAPPLDVPDPSLPQEFLAQRSLIARAQAVAKAAMESAMRAVSGGGGGGGVNAGAPGSVGSAGGPAACAVNGSSSSAPPGVPPTMPTASAAGASAAVAPGAATAPAIAATTTAAMTTVKAEQAPAAASEQSAGASAPVEAGTWAMKTEAVPADAAAVAVTPASADGAAADGDVLKVVVAPEQDKQRRHFLDRLARYVAKDGALFEAKIREREAGNAEYAFLFEPESGDGHYYRWRVFAFLMGDKEYRWRGDPFRMSPGGRLWVPPPPPTGEDAEDPEKRRRREEREKERQ